MFCKHCGTQLPDDSGFCTNCGKPLKAVAVTPVTYSASAAASVPAAKPSYFDGKLIALIGINILTGLLTTISLGFAYPAMYCFKMRWYYSSTIVNGYRLKFTGTGGQLFGKYILWTFLTIITLGIFGLWLPIKYQRWETSHVEIDCEV